MKPEIVYIDDEPRNLAVFEAAVPADWSVHTFHEPLTALTALEKLHPWVIMSDQRMPGIKGVQLLELARKLHPEAVRIIVTGYSDEDLIIESVRKANVFDYIRKPWDPEDLEAAIGRAISYFKMTTERNGLIEKLQEQQKNLEEQNKALASIKDALQQTHDREVALRRELECWVPPFVLWALNENKMKFPIKRDLVGVAFDIINSSDIHGVSVDGRSLRSWVIGAFSEAILRFGGWRESHAGDSAYAHFGLMNNLENPADSALAAAREFRVALRNISQTKNVKIECGIGLHVARNSEVSVHEVSLPTKTGTIVQKSFDTTSSGIDLLHRIESLVHELPGSNIIMSEDFVSSLRFKVEKLIELGYFRARGQVDAVKLFMLPSDLVGEKEIAEFQSKHFTHVISLNKKHVAA